MYHYSYTVVNDCTMVNSPQHTKRAQNKDFETPELETKTLA